ncbi:SAM-dependent methyltransferase [Mycobacterium adipatum]|uniref:SAM-dependent methyltransferase n=1 Tax=Mycobacterium adipatum TaxID=1682113 RepID=A0A172UTS1_9MYCO|nr:methyltransferase domain-containing protein [Mycobacterium adipatum]ANE82395.1 SAM-dependent methyltransferase [Mycobacterium adipatum]MBI5736687.1 methyltransferase domain-containing protein [Mycolicibacterium neoaurum]
MTTIQRRAFNDAITRFWSFAAPAYDTGCLQRLVYKPAQDEVVEQLRRHGCKQIADVACGTGILATRIQQELRPDEVYGLDMSDGMLAQARQRCDRVRWMSAPAEQLPFEDGFLDAVVTTSAFHFFDQPAALAEFHRVLTPGGIVAVTTMSPRHSLPVLHALSAGLGAPAHAPTAEAMRKLFVEAGFQVEDQHRVRRPVWTPVSDLITVGVKPA